MSSLDEMKLLRYAWKEVKAMENMRRWLKNSLALRFGSSY